MDALLQKMLCADNALRVAAEAEYASLLQADPTAVAAALVGVCCGGGVAHERLLGLALLRRVVGTAWHVVDAPARRAAAPALLGALDRDRAGGATAAARGRCDCCAALVQYGLGLDANDPDAAACVLAWALARLADGGDRAAALLLVARVAAEASPRALAAAAPVGAALAGALGGARSAPEAVAACEATFAFVAECEYPEHFAAAADAVAAAVATLANAARGGHAAACRDILAALATLLDEPLVSWTTYLPSKARSLEAHVEAVGDACAGILGAGDATADLARVALEVLGALLEAAMYWRRDAAPGLGARVGPACLGCLARGFRDLDVAEWAAAPPFPRDDEDLERESEDAAEHDAAEDEALSPLAAAAAATLRRAAACVGPRAMLEATFEALDAGLAAPDAAERYAALRALEILSRDLGGDAVALALAPRTRAPLCAVAADDASPVVRERAFAVLARFALECAGADARAGDDDAYFSGFDDGGDRVAPAAADGFAAAFGPSILPAVAAGLGHARCGEAGALRVAAAAATALAAACEPGGPRLPAALEGALVASLLALAGDALARGGDRALACAARCALAAGRAAWALGDGAAAALPGALDASLGAALDAWPADASLEAQPQFAALLGRLFEAACVATRARAARGVFDCEPSRRFGDLRRLVALATREAGEASSALTRRVLGGAARWCDALLGARGGDALRLDVARVVALLACAAADRDVAYDTFGSVRDARAFAAEHGGCDVVTCFSASDEATYFALDGSTLATNEVALRSLYEVLRRHRNAAGLAPERLGLAAALCAALSHEWLRFAPTAVTVAAAVLARLAAAGGGDGPAFFAAVAPTLLRHAAALRDRCGGAEVVSFDGDADDGGDADDDSRAGALRSLQALTMVLEALAELLEMPGACGELSDDDLRVVAAALADAAAAGWRRRADFADVFDGAGGDDADATRDAEREVQETCGRGLRAIAGARAATPFVRELADQILAPCLAPCLEPDGDWPDDLRCEAFVSAACLAVDVAAHCPPGAALPGRLRGPMLAAARDARDDVRQCGAWGLGVLAARDAGLRPEALAALAAALAAYPADGTLGPRDAASDNAAAALLKVLPLAGDAAGAAAAGAAALDALPLVCDVEEARAAHATALRALAGDADNVAALERALADAQRRLPPPPWVRDLLARDAPPPSPARRLRVFRRFGGDAAAARAHAAAVADAAAIVDAGARRRLLGSP